MKKTVLILSLSFLSCVSHGMVDLDHNGLSDVYELVYFGGPADPDADPDGDGFNNFVELVWGTNPTNASSRVTGLKATVSGQTVHFSWAAAPGKWYRLQSSDDLLNWHTVQEGSFSSRTEPMGAPGSGSAVKFWRIEVLLDSPESNGTGLDTWEEALYLQAFGVLPANRDSDGDGLSNLEELLRGHNPAKKDNPAVGLIVFTPLEK